MSLKIAIPSDQPGGLDAAVSAHFGHCDLYTLVTLQEGEPVDIRIIPNVPHTQGGCLAPVNHLAEHGVNTLIAGGMGMRPLAGFQSAGIDVYHSSNAPTVGMAVQALAAGNLTMFSKSNVCGGGSNCGSH